ncbi:hypothetical protein BJ322DRAFT_1108661 [Thelephora terrestris]|uniref:Uncharacterized protein n=1 Tax=Thelephora terrestris TaxID=56493 RepID=A0A9P6L6U7_9AGAM|nr:hypothetical protein BJ322DRAFT_1108661 [Thelephora terrestris]
MLFFYLAAFALLVMLSFHYRAQLPLPNRLRSFFPSLNYYTPVATFAEQANAGLSSGNFDIEAANIVAGDSRSGLDERATQEVLDIMRRERVNFDQARLIRQNRIFAANGIDPSGMPLDSKAITRL